MSGRDAGERPDPVFDAPWHARVFALTVHLNESGVFAWPDWAARFGATLARHRSDPGASDPGASDSGASDHGASADHGGGDHGAGRDLNGGEDYWAAWLETLEGLLAEKGLAAPGKVEEMRAAWEAAYLATPHGDPVRLGAGER